MKNIIYLVLVSIIGCTHQPSKPNFKIVSKTGKFLSLNNSSDTLFLGDTLVISFDLTNNIQLNDGSTITVSEIINTGFGYQFNKDGIYPAFDPTPMVLEKKESYLQDDGRFFFKPKLKTLLMSKIHFVPQDTGTYILTTERFQNMVSSIQGSSEQYQINLFPDFNVPSIHEYLLDPFPLAKEGKIFGKANQATPYYCFYVKPK
jgi:hypothetical protein